jgi:hypothetical protein
MECVPLHLTKVAFGIDSLDKLVERVELRLAEPAGFFITTRYLPKRVEEIAPEGVGAGSLYWIVKHQLVARSPIARFGEAEGGRVAIHLGALVLVQARPKRAHQGWRYLEGDAAPADLHGALDGIAAMPPTLVGRLTELALL